MVVFRASVRVLKSQARRRRHIADMPGEILNRLRRRCANHLSIGSSVRSRERRSIHVPSIQLRVRPNSVIAICVASDVVFRRLQILRKDWEGARTVWG